MSLPFGHEYPKIQTVYKRDQSNLIIPGLYSTPEIEYLAESLWEWTEKVDGTNIRVHWNGQGVSIGGRTDAAQVPTPLLQELTSLLAPDLWKETFSGSDDVTLYGEGYGPKIQNGRHYREDHALVLFDIRIGNWWLERVNVLDIAQKFNLSVVPRLPLMTIPEAVREVQERRLISAWEGATVEGLVGRPVVELFSRKGERIMTKIKVKDFEQLERRSPRG